MVIKWFIRWHNHLNPEIKKTAWTEEEDQLIFELHQAYGNKWAKIAKFLPGRYVTFARWRVGGLKLWKD